MFEGFLVEAHRLRLGFFFQLKTYSFRNASAILVIPFDHNIYIYPGTAVNKAFKDHIIATEIERLRGSAIDDSCHGMGWFGGVFPQRGSANDTPAR